MESLVNVLNGLNLMDLLGRVLAAALILAVGWLAIRILAKSFKRLLSRIEEDRRMAVGFVLSVVVKTCWAVLAIVILGKLGVNVGPLIAGLGVTGFVLGFAFQESLGSLASGLMIALNHPFKVGDHVTVCGFEGTVRKLDMMAVILDTKDNRRVTIPNKAVWSGPIANFSALERAQSVA